MLFIYPQYIHALKGLYIILLLYFFHTIKNHIDVLSQLGSQHNNNQPGNVNTNNDNKATFRLQKESTTYNRMINDQPPVKAIANPGGRRASYPTASTGLVAGAGPPPARTAAKGAWWVKRAPPVGPSVVTVTPRESPVLQMLGGGGGRQQQGSWKGMGTTLAVS